MQCGDGFEPAAEPGVADSKSGVEQAPLLSVEASFLVGKSRDEATRQCAG